MSALKLAPPEYARNAFSFKWKYDKLAVVVNVLQTTQNLVIHVVVLQRTAIKCTKNYNARAKLLFCSLNLLFGDVLVAVAVVFCVRSLLQSNHSDGNKNVDRENRSRPCHLDIYKERFFSPFSKKLRAST